MTDQDKSTFCDVVQKDLGLKIDHSIILEYKQEKTSSGRVFFAEAIFVPDSLLQSEIYSQTSYPIEHYEELSYLEGVTYSVFTRVVNGKTYSVRRYLLDGNTYFTIQMVHDAPR